MEKPNKASVRTAVLVVATVLCAILARVFGKLGYAYVTFGLIRTMLYIGLYAAWGIPSESGSCRRRCAGI